MPEPMIPAERMAIEITDDWLNQEPVIPDVQLSELDSEHWQRLRALITTALRAVERETVNRADAWMEHSRKCIRSFYEAGEPTPGGGYRQKFNGVWYSSCPVDETPKCNCGLDEFLDRAQGGTDA